MVWLFVSLSLLTVGIVFYYSFPLLKKIFKKQSKSNENEKLLKRQKKEDEKLEKRKIKSVKKEGIDASNPNAISDDGKSKIENERAIDLKEDPDTKVNYDNFDLEGLFDEEDKKKSDVEESPIENPFDGNLDDLFNEYFGNDQYNQLTNGMTNDLKTGNAPGDDDIREFLEEYDMLSREKSTIAEDFSRLSPEMKALFISDFLDKKE